MLSRPCCPLPPLFPFSVLAVLCNLCLSYNCGVKQMLSANFLVHTEPSALEVELLSDLQELAYCAMLPENLIPLSVQPRHLQMVVSSTVLLGPSFISAAQSLTTS